MANPKSAPKQRKITEAITMRGRLFSVSDLRLIRKLVKTHFKKGRTHISIEICKALNWKQPNGWLKERACRDVLRTIRAMRYIALPKPKVVLKKLNKRPRVVASLFQKIDTSPINTIVFSTIRLQQVKGTKDEALWNSLVDKYHYLGFQVFVGRSIKYLVVSAERIIAALGFCDPAWSLAPRDIPFKRFGYDMSELRSRGINNGRYLIMPWVAVPNLASHILSLATKRIRIDWEEYYSSSPLFLETFVDPLKFPGTCYKASNWVCIGRSQGYSKSGMSHHNSQAPKLLYIYPFDRKLSTELQQYTKEVRSGVPAR